MRVCVCVFVFVWWSTVEGVTVGREGEQRAEERIGGRPGVGEIEMCNPPQSVSQPLVV